MVYGMQLDVSDVHTVANERFYRGVLHLVLRVAYFFFFFEFPG